MKDKITMTENNLFDKNIQEEVLISSNNSNPEDRIYNVAVNQDIIDWKSFLYELIYKEGLNPWDIDLGILTKKYLLALKDLKEIDFNISGKFLTVAVYLLKTKSEKLLESDIRGFENEIDLINQEDNLNDFEDLNDFDELDENQITANKKKEYKLKFRNPIARKRKVNIFDLIKTLEKTFEQSNKRRTNFLQRHVGDIDYDGPNYNKKKKDLKQIIEELFEDISNRFNKSDFVKFSSIIENSKTKLDVIEVFMPLLHLHNDLRVELKQDNHFDEIRIHNV